MGLPQINITFREKGVSAIKRSGRGIVALILKDDTPSFASKEYKRLDEVEKEDFTEDNYDYLVQVFRGTPSKVIVEVIDTESGEVSEALGRLKNKRFNYMAMADAEVDDNTEIESFIQSSNEIDNKTFKAVLANQDSDSDVIENFTTNGIVVGEKTYTAEQYTPRIAGLLAGISLDRSATYFVLPEVEAIDSIDEPGVAIDNGELILIDDGEKIKIGRAVTSLVTTTTDKGDSFKKIKIVEGTHMMQDDIRNTFEDEYVGKYINDYDNKVLFVTACNAYLKELEKSYVLDRSFENKIEIDLDSQRLFIEGKGITTEDMSEQEIKEYNTGSNVFVKANVKFVDAMEDLDLNIFM